MGFVGDDDLRLLLASLSGWRSLRRRRPRHPSARCSSRATRPIVPVALLAVAPFRVPVQLGSEEAFLLLPLYLAIAAAVLALAYRILRGERTAAASVPARRADRRLRHLRVDVVPLDLGRACGSESRSRSSSSRSCRSRESSPARHSRDWLPRALLVTLVATRHALRGGRDLAGTHAHVVLRTRRRGRQRVHVVLQGHVALQGSEPLRPPPRDRDRRAARRDLRAPRRARAIWLTSR